MNSINLIATDIDGTLLTSEHELTPRTEKAIRAALERGIHIVIATGKTRASTQALTEQLGLKMPGVYVQGLVIYDENDGVVHQQLLDEMIFREVLDFAKETDYEFMAYSGMKIFAKRHGPYTQRMVRYHEPHPTVLDSMHSLLGSTPINKIQFFDTAERIAEVKKIIEPMIKERAVMTMPNYEILEVLPLGASKGAGLKHLLDVMKIDPANVIAFGDGENDIEMLQLAGIGVAMGNAMPKLKAVADYVTASNDEDGVALAIERFVLNDTP
jgi:Cof subfamily protein (haloacid dehalogenase superfamily)